MDETTGNSRLLRNEGEKLRRDRLNSSINELGQMLPVVSGANRKVDKSTILRQATNYLRFHKDFVERGDFYTSVSNLKHLQRLSSLLLESRKGFLFVLSKDGTLVFATELFTSQLGHSLLDIIGVSFYSLLHPEDRDIIAKVIDDYSQETSSSSTCSCFVRISSTLTFHQNHYECVHIQGFLRKVPKLKPAFSTENTKEGDEIYFTAVGRIVTGETIKEIGMLPEEVSNDVWVTQSSLDGHVLHISQSFALISGRMPSECIDVSSYDTIHKDDIPVCARQHVKALQSGPRDILGIYLRFADVNHDTIYTYCTTHMVANPWTKKLKHIVTVHHIISEEEGKKQIQDQLEKVSSGISQLSIEGSPSSQSNESEIMDSVSTGTLSVESVTSAELEDKSGDSSCSSFSPKSFTETEEEINFLPELVQLTQFVDPTDQDEQRKLVVAFKEASNRYKAQAGIQTAAIGKSSNQSSKIGSPPVTVSDVEKIKKDSSQMFCFNKNLGSEAKKAQKRKRGRVTESAVKTPLLHNLLTQGCSEEDSSKIKQFRNIFDIDFSLLKLEPREEKVIENKIKKEDDDAEMANQAGADSVTKINIEDDTQRQHSTMQLKEEPNDITEKEPDLLKGSTINSEEGSNMKPDTSQGEVDMTIQLHLAQQLQGKYEMLQEKLSSQEKEITELKAKTELFMSLSPEKNNEAKQNVLHHLESKRKRHEMQLLKLKQDYAAQMSVLTMDTGSCGSVCSTKSPTPSSLGLSPQSVSSIDSGTSSRSNSVSPISTNQNKGLYSVESQYQSFSSPSDYGRKFEATTPVQQVTGFQYGAQSTSPVGWGYFTHSGFSNESHSSTGPFYSTGALNTVSPPVDVQSRGYYGGVRMSASPATGSHHHGNNFNQVMELPDQTFPANISQSVSSAPSPQYLSYIGDTWVNPNDIVPCQDPNTCPTGGHCNDKK